MKRKFLFIPLLFIIFKGFANPLPSTPVISEIYFSDGIFQIEFYFDDFWWFENFDELILISSTDTVEFIDGIEIPLYEVFVLDVTHLAEAFNFNPEGDLFDIIDDEWGQSIGSGPIFFGNHPYARVLAPNSNQSIAYDKYYDWEWGFYNYALTLEQPPTIGTDPLATQARGILDGYVFDQEDNPVPGASLLDVVTNDSGYFFKTDLHCCINYFIRVYYGGVEYFLQEGYIVEPYDTTERIFHIDTLLTSINSPQNPTPDISNYPNPFTRFTTFNVLIPGEIKFIEASINIYDLTGKLIDRIEIPTGEFSANWSSNGKASGIYLYNIELDDKQYTSQKMIIL